MDTKLKTKLSTSNFKSKKGLYRHLKKSKKKEYGVIINLTGLLFLEAAISCIISSLFLRRLLGNGRVKNFSLGLFFSGIGFAIISLAIFGKFGFSINYWISIGLFLVLVSMIFLLRSATQHLKTNYRRFVIILAGHYGVALFWVRSAYPSQPFFLDSGIFSFNAHPAVKIMEGILFTCVLLPANLNIYLCAKESDRLSANALYFFLSLIYIGMTLIVVGVDESTSIFMLLTLAGAYFGLLITSLGFFRLSIVTRIIYVIYNIFDVRLTSMFEKIK